MPDKGNLIRQGLFWLTVWVYSPSWQEGSVPYPQVNMVAAVWGRGPLHLHLGSRERWMLVLTFFFLFSLGSQPVGWPHSHSGWSSLSLKPFWKYPLGFSKLNCEECLRTWHWRVSIGLSLLQKECLVGDKRSKEGGPGWAEPDLVMLAFFQFSTTARLFDFVQTWQFGEEGTDPFGSGSKKRFAFPSL